MALAAVLMLAAPLSAQEQPFFRAATRLVQVSVVVEDRNGRPVTGLSASDFRIFDGDREQRLELFLPAEGAAATPTRPAFISNATAPSGPPAFTNRMAVQRNVTVVLFDRLNTPANDQIYARQHLIAFLQQIKSDDRVGLYVLESDTVRVLHDFTNDTSSLVRAMSRYRAMTANEAVELERPDMESTGNATLDAQLEAFLANAHENMAAHFRRLRAEVTIAAFRAIANRLVGVEGRKNLVWISAGLSLKAFAEVGRNAGAAIQQLIRPLNDANVTVYAVDARGLMPAVTLDARGKASFTTLSTVQDPQDILQIAAGETGGRAFVNTNDINGAVRRAVSDAQSSYTFGYYPNHAKWDGAYRQIKVQVNRRGLRVRHRKGYLATAIAERVTARTAVNAAIASPLEAIGLELSARLERVVGTDSDLKATIDIAPGAVAFERSGDVWQGAIEVVIVQKLPDGMSRTSVDRHIDFRLPNDRYEQAREKGFGVDLQLTLRPEALSLHIVVHDVVSGTTGSIVVPANRLHAIRAQ